ncbi:hypothetical protein AMECASPLE_011070, partial [Ameca splendens]
ENHALLQNILTNQEMMMDQMKINFTTVQGLKSATEEDIGVEPNLLPLAHPQSVENLEERLRNSPDLKNQLKNALALKGGGDIKECVKRVAASLTHTLAKNMNMQGINGKIGFQHLQVKEVMIVQKLFWASAGSPVCPQLAHVWAASGKSELGHQRAIILCGIWAESSEREKGVEEFHASADTQQSSPFSSLVASVAESRPLDLLRCRPPALPTSYASSPPLLISSPPSLRC